MNPNMVLNDTLKDARRENKDLHRQVLEMTREVHQIKATWIEPAKAKVLYQRVTTAQCGWAEEKRLTQALKTQIHGLEVALAACQEGQVVTYPLVFEPAQLAYRDSTNATKPRFFLDKSEEIPLRRDHVKKYKTVNPEDVKSDLSSSDTIFEYIAKGDCKFVKAWLHGLLYESTGWQLLDKAGWSILHDAIILNHVDIAQHLINHSPMNINFPCNSTSIGLHNLRPIHIACEFGRTSILKMLLQRNVNPELCMEVIKSELIEPVILSKSSTPIFIQKFNISDTYVLLDAWNPLHLVVIHDHLDCLKMLIQEAKVFIESRSIISRKTALILACELCRLETVNVLLESGANPNVCDISNKSPLFYAAKRGHDTIVEVLLKYGANPRIGTKRHQITPLHASCISNNIDNLAATIQLIKSAPEVVYWKSSCVLEINRGQINCTKVNCFLLVILKSAVCLDDVQFNCHIKKINYLLSEYKVDINSVCTVDGVSNNNGLHILLIIVKKFQFPLRKELIDILLAHRININETNSKNESILFLAVQLNLLGLVNNLLIRGSDPNIGRNQPITSLMFSIQKRHKKVTELLINYGANINENVCFDLVLSNVKLTNCASIHVALIYSDQETFQFLIDKGANPFLTVDLLDEREVETNVTLLHLAILLKSNSLNYINFLLEMGLNIESKTSKGDTPFLFAIRYSKIEACNLLLFRGCDKNAVNAINESGLILSAIKKNPDIMKFLLQNQVDLNQKDNYGLTALHHSFIQDFRIGIDYFIHDSTNIFIAKIDDNDSSHSLKSGYLIYALQYGNEIDVVRVLKQAADPDLVFIHNNVTMTPIFLAVEMNSISNMCHLIRHGANLNYISSPNQETVLHVALRNKNIAIAKELIFAGSNIHLRSRLGQGEEVLPIHVAVQNGLDEIIEILLMFGSSLNSTMILKSVERVNPLHLAALNDLTSTVKFLTHQQSASININSTRSDSFNALLTLVSKRNVIGVQSVLMAGADVSGKCIVSRSRNATCLHIAAQVGSFEIVQLLLEYGADPFARMITGDRDGILPVHLATESGHLEIVKLFFDWGVSVSAAEDCGLTCLHYAANAGSVDIMEILLKAGADVNAEATDGNRSKMLPIHMASEKGHKKSVKLLLEYGSPINAVFSRLNRDNLTALYIATSENRENVMKYLIKSGANPDIQENNLGATPLHITCQRGFTKAIMYLIGIANSSLNVPLNTGISSLHLTAEKGHNELSFWLLRCKCNPNLTGQITDSFSKKTSYNISPLNQACGFGHLTVVKLLVKFGADIHWAETFEGHKGIQPIHCAAIRGKYHVIPTLLEAGVSIDEPDEDGLTPLHWSVIEGFYDCTKFLIGLKANVNIIDKIGKKPKDYAVTANLMSLF